MGIIPNVSAEAFSFSAVVIGFLLIDDTTATEQNALGNWLMLVAQILCTNAFYQQLQAERKNSTSAPNTGETIIMLQKMMDAMQKEIEELKKQL